MKNYFLIKLFFSLSILFLLACNNKEELSQFYHPADFDPSEATCFVWSPVHKAVIAELSGIISKKDKVKIYVDKNDDDNSEILTMLQNNGADLKNINLVGLNNRPNNVWIRDFGPIYLVNKLGERKLVDFMHFGNQNTFITEMVSDLNIPHIKSSYNSSGGAREVNGKGTIILCEAHELDVNKTMTKEEIEQEVYEKLAIKKIIWMEKGIPQDDNPLTGPIHGKTYPNGINGHVDEFCRFADANTILISSVTVDEAEQSPVLAEAKRRLDKNYEILQNSTDQDGNKFNIVKVPMAPLRIVNIKRKYSTVVTSYMNFIITNSMVIVPSYYYNITDDIELKKKEEEVNKIFNEIFPFREVVSLNAIKLNYYSGGFHCISINEPLVN